MKESLNFSFCRSHAATILADAQIRVQFHPKQAPNASAHHHLEAHKVRRMFLKLPVNGKRWWHVTCMHRMIFPHSQMMQLRWGPVNAEIGFHCSSQPSCIYKMQHKPVAIGVTH